MGRVNCLIKNDTLGKMKYISQHIGKCSGKYLIVAEKNKINRYSKALVDSNIQNFSLCEDTVSFRNITKDRNSFEQISSNVVLLEEQLFFKLLNNRKVKNGLEIKDFNFDYIIFENVDIFKTQYEDKKFFETVDLLKKYCSANILMFFNVFKYEFLHILYYFTAIKNPSRLNLLNIKSYMDYEDIFIKDKKTIIDSNGNKKNIVKYTKANLLLKLLKIEKIDGYNNFIFDKDENAFEVENKIIQNENTLIENLIDSYKNNKMCLVECEEDRDRIFYYDLKDYFEENLLKTLIERGLRKEDIKYFSIINQDSIDSIDDLKDNVKIIFTSRKNINRLYYLFNKINVKFHYVKDISSFKKKTSEKMNNLELSKELLCELMNCVLKAKNNNEEKLLYNNFAQEDYDKIECELNSLLNTFNKQILLYKNLLKDI